MEELGVVGGPAIVDADVAAIDPAEVAQPIFERSDPQPRLWIIGSERHQDADAPHAFGLLRSRRQRPRGSRRAAEQRDELAPSHSITSSALASSLSGTVRPSILAV